MSAGEHDIFAGNFDCFAIQQVAAAAGNPLAADGLFFPGRVNQYQNSALFVYSFIGQNIFTDGMKFVITIPQFRMLQPQPYQFLIELQK